MKLLSVLMPRERERAYRFGDTFMLLMLDLDNFHPVNNRHGHRTGDRILLELARRLRAQLREIDMVARFGGDQFAMILPHTFETGGLEVAERVRQNVAGWVFLTADGVELRLTVSTGVCSYPHDGTTAPELVEQVCGTPKDKFLEVAEYCKDQLGKNQFAGILVENVSGRNVEIPEAHRLIADIPFAGISSLFAITKPHILELQ